MTSLRARKKRETSEALAYAAYSEVLEHGIDHTTTGSIAARAGVSRRTFANYYGNKHAAVVDGFMMQLGIWTWEFSDPAGVDSLPNTFSGLLDLSQSFITEIFQDPRKIALIHDFMTIVHENRALEPYLHAVFLEFHYSPTHEAMVARFGEEKVALFLGALIGSLGSIFRAVLGPEAFAPGQHQRPDLGDDAAATVLTYIDQAFVYLRHGFVDQ